MPKIESLHAIKNPAGLIIFWSVSLNKRGCIANYMRKHNLYKQWKSYKSKGFECVPVTITESKNK